MKNQISHQQVRILIVSDSPILHSGLQRILESQPGIRVLDDVNFQMARTHKTLLRHKPDLILFDLDPRSNDNLEVLSSLKKTFKNSAVILLSELTDHELTRKALALGGVGIVLKIQPPAVLIAAIQELCPRQHYDSISREPTIHSQEKEGEGIEKTQVSVPGTGEAPRIESLTAREREVIRLVALGLKNKDIASRLSITDITVRHHLTSIFCKLEVADRQNLLLLAHRYGLADLTLHSKPA